MRILAILVAPAAAFFSVTFAIAEPISSESVWVDDGDTIRVGTKVYRLVGFDTPETLRTTARLVR